MRVEVTLNGSPCEADVPPGTLLVELVRGVAGLTGTHVGCETTTCGACTVLLDGESVKSCTVLAVQAEHRDVVTIEGLAGPDALHPVQQAFTDHHAVQCGFCTPGMVLAAVSLLEDAARPDGGGPPDDAAVRAGLKGNLCRCTGYVNIVRAVVAAGAAVSPAAGAAVSPAAGAAVSPAAGAAATSPPLAAASARAATIPVDGEDRP